MERTHDEPMPSADDLFQQLMAIVSRVDALPVLDSRSADEIIGYDKDGLPI
jgi:antitoxin VapB